LKKRNKTFLPISFNQLIKICFSALLRTAQTATRLEAKSEKTMLMLLATAVFAWSFSLGGQLNDSVPFPKAFRKWAHVKSVLVGPESAAFATEGGIHHIYANEKALEGYDTGKFPDGSVIVYDLLETKEIAGNTLEGPTRRVDVMVKQSQRYRTTGGWEFMSFPGDNKTDGKITAERKTTCFGCHAHRKDHDFVFSEFRK
jgi:hypothetical protein